MLDTVILQFTHIEKRCFTDECAIIILKGALSSGALLGHRMPRYLVPYTPKKSQVTVIP